METLRVRFGGNPVANRLGVAYLGSLDLSLQCGIHRIINKLAEREGFEPSVPRKEDNGFRDRPVRPLRHLSMRTAARAYHGPPANIKRTKIAASHSPVAPARQTRR